MKKRVITRRRFLQLGTLAVVGLATPGCRAPVSAPPPTATPLSVRENPTAVVETTGKGAIKVTFINPGISDPNDPTGGFWRSVAAFMMAAAEDLDINLEVIYSERDHLAMQRQAREVAAREILSDYLVVVNEKLAADEMVKAADQAGLKTFVMLNTFVDEQVAEMGAPREKYKNWLGSLIPDNRAAGYQIAKQVIDRALEAGVTADDGKLHLLAIAGDHVTPASVQRVEGMEQAIAEYDNVELSQVLFGEWSQDKTYEQTKIAIGRYPQTGAIWAANDPMALGAIKALEELQKQPGKDIFVGGLNWDAPAMEKLQNGTMVTSVGGHFMTGGWTLVLLHDYHQGRDFAAEGVELQRQIFGVLDGENVGAFVDKFGDRDWGKIDFTKFSKVLNPDIETYDFSLEAILRQFD